MADARKSAGRRAVRNTGIRAVAEMIGKFSSLILFAAIARELGQGDLGILTFAFAYAAIVMTPVGFGTDPLLLREVARSREAIGRMLWDVVALKLAVGAVVLTLGLALLWPLGYDAEARAVTIVLAAGLAIDLLAKTGHAIFNAIERSELLAASVLAQRLFTAAVGVLVLVLGGGLLEVAVVFTCGSAIHLWVAWRGVARSVGLPPWHVRPSEWWPLSRRSAPFAVQDVLTVLLFKLDAVLLSLLAAEAAVGRYGAAYRLIEATMFVGFSLNSAFAAMYVYLGRDTEPTLGGIFARSLKMALLLLVPVAVVLGVLAEDVCTAVFGADFAEAADATRLLAPVVVLLTVIALCTTLVISRTSPRRILPVTASMVVLNAALNIALVPEFEERGAAAAMLITELVFGAIMLWLAVRETGPLRWPALLGSPVLAGAALAGTLVALSGAPLVAIAVGGVVYAGVFVLVERRLAPADLEFAADLLRDRFRPAAARP